MNTVNFNIKHIFFDLDNTLWDFKTNSELILNQLFNEFGLRQEFHNFLIFHHIYKHHNQNMWIAYNNGEITRTELIFKRFYLTLKERDIDDKILAEDMVNYYLELSTYQTKLFPGTKEILKYLNTKNYICHIISNGFIDTQSKKIENSGLKKYFKTFTFSEEVGYSKPSKEIFELALSKSNANANESLMVGDNFKTDIKGALNINMKAILINNTNISPTDKHITLPTLYCLSKIL